MLEAPLDDVDPVAALVQRVLRLGDLQREMQFYEITVFQMIFRALPAS